MSRPDLEQQIITSAEAEAFLRMVTKGFYNQSFTGLWIYEVIGREWDEMRAWAEGLKEEINPQTCTWSVPIWEWVYGIEPDESLGLDFRRQRLLAKITTARPINPEVIRRGVAALVGASVDAVEVNDFVGPYRFEVIIHPQGTPLPYNRINPYIRGIKPSHLRFEADIETKVEIRVLIETRWNLIGFGLTGQYDAGTRPNTNIKAQLYGITVEAEISAKGAKLNAQDTGTSYASADGTDIQRMPTPSTIFRQSKAEIKAAVGAQGYAAAAPMTSESRSETGQYPHTQLLGRSEDSTIAAEIGGKAGKFMHTPAGTAPDVQHRFMQTAAQIQADADGRGYAITAELTGTQPEAQITLGKTGGGIVPIIQAERYTIKYTMCGTEITKSSS